MKVVELDRVSKDYGPKRAVAELSLSIDSGTMFGLLGPNGAGKTSAIRMMTGITLPDSGQVQLFGKPFERKLLNRVGFLPEERGLYKKMKVLEQLTFFGQLRGLNASSAEAKAKAWCERLEIEDTLNQATEALSKGMQQKIQFIATLLHDPELIIMDEPFSGLDPMNSKLLQDVLIDLKKAGRAILFSTHRMEQVERLCDEICLINAGRAVVAGTICDVKRAKVQNRIAISFEGDDSFLHHTTVDRANRLSGYVEVWLRDGADSQALLRAACERARVYRFALMEPSLEEIFLEAVGEHVHA